MLIRFSVENFLSFGKKQEFTMIPSRIKTANESHIIQESNVSLLKLATIYGANASGKSNLIKAIAFAKTVITKKLPIESNSMFCRTNKKNENIQSKFEFEIIKNGKCYAYGFSVLLSKQRIESEWLYELLPTKKEQRMIFERETDNNRIELGVDLAEEDKMRFETYKLDFTDNHISLFLTEMNRNKRMSESSGLYVFSIVYNWFKNDLTPIFPEQPITNFNYFYGEGEEDCKINKIIELFDTGISKVKIHEISLTDFKEKFSSGPIDKILDSINTRMEESANGAIVKASIRTPDSFFNLVGKKGSDLKITIIKLEHGNNFYDFDFGEESDGTRRLFDLLEILITNRSNVVYVIDEMERSLHPKLTYKFLELFLEILREKNVQLIFTTHESTIMDQDLLRRDEIWFVERDKNNNSFIFSLDRFKERYDKKISKSYLDGRYGAIPIFKKFLFKGGEC